MNAASTLKRWQFTTNCRRLFDHTHHGSASTVADSTCFPCIRYRSKSEPPPVLTPNLASFIPPARTPTVHRAKIGGNPPCGIPLSRQWNTTIQVGFWVRRPARKAQLIFPINTTNDAPDKAYVPLVSLVCVLTAKKSSKALILSPAITFSAKLITTDDFRTVTAWTSLFGMIMHSVMVFAILQVFVQCTYSFLQLPVNLKVFFSFWHQLIPRASAIVISF